MAGVSQVDCVPRVGFAARLQRPEPVPEPRSGGFPVVLAILHVGLLTAVPGLVAGPSTAAVTYLVSSVLVAVWLAIRFPTDYVVFVATTWVIAPEIRRVIDWGMAAFNPFSLASITPYAVVLAGLAGMVGRQKLSDRDRTSLLMVYAALGMGAAVGMLSFGVAGAGYALLEWASPVLVIHYSLVRRLDAAVLRRGLLLATLLIAVYGIIQYYELPAWDRFWIANAPINSVGKPTPGDFRVFSTLNSPGTLSMVLAVLMLYLLTTFRPLDLVVLVPALTCLALTLVRSAWTILAIGVLFLVVGGRMHRWPRRGFLALAVTAVALVLVGPAQSVLKVGDRVSTVGSLSEDQSFSARVAFFHATVGKALLAPVGYGLGSTGVSSRLSGPDPSALTTDFDNGVLDIPFNLGWIGSVLFLAGLVRLYRVAGVFPFARRGPPYGRVLIAAIVGLFFANVLTGASGYFLGLVMVLHRKGRLSE